MYVARKQPMGIENLFLVSYALFLVSLLLVP
jgi:hypothetical protein